MSLRYRRQLRAWQNKNHPINSIGWEPNVPLLTRENVGYLGAVYFVNSDHSLSNDYDEHEGVGEHIDAVRVYYRIGYLDSSFLPRRVQLLGGN